MVTDEKDIKKRVAYYLELPYTIIVKHHDEQGGYYTAGYLELPDLIMTGDTPENAVKELLLERPEWFETCVKLGIPVPEPHAHYSGNINIRVDPALHAQLAQEAAAFDMSLNKYTSLVLERRSTGVLSKEKASVVREKRMGYKARKSGK